MGEGRHFIQDASEGPYVGLVVVGLVVEQLGGHVIRCSDTRASKVHRALQYLEKKSVQQHFELQVRSCSPAPSVGGCDEAVYVLASSGLTDASCMIGGIQNPRRTHDTNPFGYTLLQGRSNQR